MPTDYMCNISSTLTLPHDGNRSTVTVTAESLLHLKSSKQTLRLLQNQIYSR